MAELARTTIASSRFPRFCGLLLAPKAASKPAEKFSRKTLSKLLISGAFLGSFLGALVGGEGEAAAQLHWDASAQVGVMKRFVGDKPNGGSDVGFGPVGQLTGHIALLPLVHAGAYFAHDISPLPKDGARNITSMGLRAKVALPLRGSMRAWGFLGFGYALAHQQSYATTFFVPGPLAGREAKEGTVEEAGGSFFDVPFGLGASYKLFGPLHLCGELGARFGFGHSGSIYGDPHGPQLTVAGEVPQNTEAVGVDRFALGLTVGVMLDF